MVGQIIQIEASFSWRSIFLSWIQVESMRFNNDICAWGLNLTKYVHDAVKNMKSYAADKLDGNYKLSSISDNPFNMSYTHELD